jgi:anti-sigma regulatory factor (Ser/Thr protein kinase)
MAEQSAESDMRLEMFSQPRLLAAARSMVGNFAQRLGFNEIQCGQVSLAIDEALCNIINHGYERRPDGRIWISLWDMRTDPPGVRVVIEDRAKEVDPATIKHRDLDDIRPGGLGVYIIREIMDEVVYERRDGGGMRLTLTKQATADPADSATDQPQSERQHD